MKRLRHPIRALREPFGTAGLIVALVALVAALGGTAFAASKLNSTQKKEVSKIAQTEAKKYAGKDGAPGATGPAGSAGANGKDGTNGTNGTNGADGADGESVAITNIAAGGECGAGVTGTKFSNGTGSGHVCNGKNGTTGFTETLPPGKTETGTWAFELAEEGKNGPGFQGMIPISFPIPLSEKLAGTGCLFEEDADTCQVRVVTANGKEVNEELEPVVTSSKCTGTVARPTAEVGYLCVYIKSLTETGGANFEAGFLFSPEAVGSAFSDPQGASTTGAILRFAFLETGAGGYGSWAVTAE